MTQINCQITKVIQKDFNSLWQCKQRGNTIEISTPYLLPDSTLLALFITERNKKFIVHDGGGISQIVSDNCPFPDDEIKASLDGFAAKHAVKKCWGASKQQIFFKDCERKSLISSIAFDLASFATTVTNILVAASYDEPNVEVDERFQRSADSFIKSAIPSDLTFKPRQEIKEVPGVKFSGIISCSNRIWLVSYVTGSTLPYFVRSVAMTKMNFEHVWKISKLAGYIGRTIPLINTDAGGYKPDKLKWQLPDLQAASQDILVKWANRASMVSLFN